MRNTSHKNHRINHGKTLVMASENCLAKQYWTRFVKVALNEMGRACMAYGEGRSVYVVSVRKPEGKSPLGRPRHRWEVNIKMDLREVGVWTGSSER